MKLIETPFVLTLNRSCENSFSARRQHDVTFKNQVFSGDHQKQNQVTTLAKLTNHQTVQFLQKLGIAKGSSFMIVGAGGGHLEIPISKLVGLRGHVTALKLSESLSKASRNGLERLHIHPNIHFETGSIYQYTPSEKYDSVHCRFVMSYLSDPMKALKKMRTIVRPGGLVIVEDADISSMRCFPKSKAFEQYKQLVQQALHAMGGGSTRATRLTSMFTEAGLKSIQCNEYVQKNPQHLIKQIPVDTVEREGFRNFVLKKNLINREELEKLTRDLKTILDDSNFRMHYAKIYQVVGTVPKN